jgi:hypothetical protein
MDFVRSYFFTNETLGSWTYLSPLLGGFAVAPTQKWWKKCSTAQSFIRKEATSYKICILPCCSQTSRRPLTQHTAKFPTKRLVKCWIFNSMCKHSHFFRVLLLGGKKVKGASSHFCSLVLKRVHSFIALFKKNPNCLISVSRKKL